MFNSFKKQISFFITPRCQLCGTNITHTPALPMCLDCFADMPFFAQTIVKTDIDPMLTQITAACEYRYPVAELLHAYKYQHNLAWVSVLTTLLLTLPKPPRNTLLVPVPSSNKRLKQRGFDHMLLITKRLAYNWQLPIWHGIKRIGDAPAQKGLNRSQRLANMQGQFKLTKMPPIGKQLLIIDDVCTTGSTIASLAQCLKHTKLTTNAYVIAYKA